MSRLILVLGDQLTEDIAALREADKTTDTVVMAEVDDEASYVQHHPKKIALIFAAMRKHAARLRDARALGLALAVARRAASGACVRRR